MELSSTTDSTSAFTSSSLGSTFSPTDMEHENRSNFEQHGNYTFGDDIISHPVVQGIFYFVYATIFVLGIFGNVLVCYVVGRNKAMQTVTNFFITNLALADILLCALAVPFTPLYTFLGEWIFGRVLCHLVPYAQGTSVYISTLTLTSIAIDRFFVIIYPFKPRMRLTTCLLIITGIWVFALLATLPYGIFLHYEMNEERYMCGESWPSERSRQVFSGCTVVLQFVLPFIIILFCYMKVSLKLSDRVRLKPGSKNSKKEALERERKRRTNRMLIAMVFIFGTSWLPLNVFNFLSDLSIDAAEWKYSNLTFFFVHAMAMSSTCYNPFLYAWLNENFRKEFKQVLPCFHVTSQTNSPRSKRFVSQRTNCNGAETVQETLMPTTSQATLQIAQGNTHTTTTTTAAMIQELGKIETVNSSQGTPTVIVDLNKVSASFTADTNDVIVHYPSPSFSSSSPPPATDNSNKNRAGTGTIDNNAKGDDNKPKAANSEPKNNESKSAVSGESIEVKSEKMESTNGSKAKLSPSQISSEKNTPPSTSTTTTQAACNEAKVDAADPKSVKSCEEDPSSCGDASTTDAVDNKDSVANTPVLI